LLNPADLPSRGCTPRALLEGPAWLRRTQEYWPTSYPEPEEEEVVREKKNTAGCMANTVSSSDPWYCQRFFSFRKSLRVLAWIMRFLGRITKKSTFLGELSTDEISTAERKVFWLVQQEDLRGKAKGNTLEGIKVEERDGLFVVRTKLT
jgi:hypothetical protein